MVELLKSMTLWLAAGVEALAAIVIGLAAIEAILRALPLFVPRRKVLGEPDAKQAIRLKLGRWLELGADILRTAVAPTWIEIGQLGTIVVLQTTLTPSCSKKRQGGDTPYAPPPALILIDHSKLPDGD